MANGNMGKAKPTRNGNNTSEIKHAVDSVMSSILKMKEEAEESVSNITETDINKIVDDFTKHIEENDFKSLSTDLYNEFRESLSKDSIELYEIEHYFSTYEYKALEQLHNYGMLDYDKNGLHFYKNGAILKPENKKLNVSLSVFLERYNHFTDSVDIKELSKRYFFQKIINNPFKYYKYETNTMFRDVDNVIINIYPNYYVFKLIEDQICLVLVDKEGNPHNPREIVIPIKEIKSIGVKTVSTFCRELLTKGIENIAKSITKKFLIEELKNDVDFLNLVKETNRLQQYRHICTCLNDFRSTSEKQGSWSKLEDELRKLEDKIGIVAKDRNYLIEKMTMKLNSLSMESLIKIKNYISLKSNNLLEFVDLNNIRNHVVIEDEIGRKFEFVITEHTPPLLLILSLIKFVFVAGIESNDDILVYDYLFSCLEYKYSNTDYCNGSNDRSLIEKNILKNYYRYAEVTSDNLIEFLDNIKYYHFEK